MNRHTNTDYIIELEILALLENSNLSEDQIIQKVAISLDVTIDKVVEIIDSLDF